MSDRGPDRVRAAAMSVGDAKQAERFDALED